MATDYYTLNFCYFITCIKVSEIRKYELNPVILYIIPLNYVSSIP